jgi:DNA-directed RNA polymerase subunit RPC12/RpoP
MRLLKRFAKDAKGGRASDANDGGASDLLASWPSPPAGVCDLCSVPIQPQGSHRVPNAEFRGAVDKGYDPFARGRVNTALYQGLGLSGDPYAAWKSTTVIPDTTDWGLCRACAEDVAEFLTGGRPRDEEAAAEVSTGIRCSVCGKSMSQIANVAQMPGVVTVGMNASALDLWFGNVCVNCKKVFCADCIEVGGPTPCPTCGEPTLPAQRMNLERIGMTP